MAVAQHALEETWGCIAYPLLSSLAMVSSRAAETHAGLGWSKEGGQKEDVYKNEAARLARLLPTSCRRRWDLPGMGDGG